MGRGGGEDLSPLEIRAAAMGGYGEQAVAAVLDARPKIVLEVVSALAAMHFASGVGIIAPNLTIASSSAQDGARQVLRLARMLGVLPDQPPAAAGPASSAFGEDEVAREEEERQREQAEATASPGALRLWLAMASKALGMREWEMCARLLLEGGVVPASRTVSEQADGQACMQSTPDSVLSRLQSKPLPAKPPVHLDENRTPPTSGPGRACTASTRCGSWCTPCSSSPRSRPPPLHHGLRALGSRPP